jgi:hypothetical protein
VSHQLQHDRADVLPVGETVSPTRDRQSEPAVSTQSDGLDVVRRPVAAAASDHRLIKQIQWFLVAFRRLDQRNAD